mgnify:CR=1 FL=1
MTAASTKSSHDGDRSGCTRRSEIEAEATSIPKFLVLDIEGMAAGTSKHASDVVLPAGTTLVSPANTIIVHLSERSTVVEEVAVVAPPAADAAAAPAADAEKKD